ncbi:diuretic hormone receptor-like isoform X2 [Schistocerca serialis cubense]|uniref:diuretic hormone receptor-like isoform X2 n=1 Tax=Schistocerca serialis cubense TaxID=2023355 RepID=UPI00214ED142|nr:diuretic hormone receptor-like isoform X2 [Schistocerca serialis cubense]
MALPSLMFPMLENTTLEELQCLLAEATGAELEAAVSGASCPRAWDSVTCWPTSPADTLVLMPCFSELNGMPYDTSQNASRWCHSNGTWSSYSNYSSCEAMLPKMEVVEVIDEVIVEVATTLYFTGYSVSLAALIVAVTIFLYFKELRCLRNAIHMNLMWAYILTDFLWILTGIVEVSEKVSSSVCVVLVLLFHYFQMTNFFWMFVEGLYLYMLVVQTFTGKLMQMRAYILIGWGVPLVIITAWGIAKGLTTGTGDPTVLITKLRSANTVETQQYRKASKALLVLIPLLGITYILIIAGPREGLSSDGYTYVRTILISTQGFMVALFYCFLNSEVQTAVRHRLDSWQTARSLRTRGRDSRRRHRSSSGGRPSKDWSPRSRTESLRMASRVSVIAGCDLPDGAASTRPSHLNGGGGGAVTPAIAWLSTRTGWN